MKNKNSFIPLGLVAGSAVGVIVGMFLEASFQGFYIVMGAAIGLLVGSVAHGFSNKN
ncbi:hypothetical protein [Caryophanon latum]|uniref:hypothetical protein n=1 Tax=Caryophanon latum TaxID=33977 RepID=UPI0014714A69|nr:hypothetical protein [Caryophanon latum]